MGGKPCTYKYVSIVFNLTEIINYFSKCFNSGFYDKTNDTHSRSNVCCPVVWEWLLSRLPLLRSPSTDSVRHQELFSEIILSMWTSSQEYFTSLSVWSVTYSVNLILTWYYFSVGFCHKNILKTFYSNIFLILQIFIIFYKCLRIVIIYNLKYLLID